MNMLLSPGGDGKSTRAYAKAPHLPVIYHRSGLCLRVSSTAKR